MSAEVELHDDKDRPLFRAFVELDPRPWHERPMFAMFSPWRWEVREWRQSFGWDAEDEWGWYIALSGFLHQEKGHARTEEKAELAAKRAVARLLRERGKEANREFGRLSTRREITVDNS